MNPSQPPPRPLILPIFPIRKLLRNIRNAGNTSIGVRLDDTGTSSRTQYPRSLQAGTAVRHLWDLQGVGVKRRGRGHVAGAGEALGESVRLPVFSIASHASV